MYILRSFLWRSHDIEKFIIIIICYLFIYMDDLSLLFYIYVTEVKKKNDLETHGIPTVRAWDYHALLG